MGDERSAGLRTSSLGLLVRRVEHAAAQLDRAPVVGISGFGGAGKSTLAQALRDRLHGSVVVPGDEFLRDRPSTERSTDWSGVDRGRLLEQVIRPVRRGLPARYQTYNARSDALDTWSEASGSTVIVEGLSLFHPDLAEQFDVRIWIDVDLDTATAQGKWRDENVWHNPQTELWDNVWKPNDRDFFDTFRPDLTADITYVPPLSGSTGDG